MDKDEKLFNRIHRLMQHGITQKAADLINKTLSADPGLSDRWLNTAMELGYRGNYDRADDYFLVLYCVRRGDPGIMHLMAINTWLQGQNENAARMCHDLIEKHPGFTGVYITLADAQYGMGQHKEALCSFDLFLKSKPQNISAWCGKGMALRALGREEEALACFGEALELEPGCARGYLATARHQVSYELYREALLFLEMALALDPDLQEAWFAKGMALARTGRFKDALACLDKAEGDDSLVIRVLTLKAWLYNLTNENALANACLDRWIELEPANPAVWEGKGGQMLSELRCEEAVNYLEKSLKLDGSRWMGWGQASMGWRGRGWAT